MRFSFGSLWVLVLVAWLGLGMGLVPMGEAAKSKSRDEADLISLLLSPGLAQWLLGPISKIATEEEIQQYLALKDDEAAREFIDEFWRKRADPTNPWPGRQVKDIFEERAKEADRLFTEGTHVGRRTDRGELYVVFGEPQKRTYLQSEGRRKQTYEVWLFDKKTVRGLDGSEPREVYYFTRKNQLTEQVPAPRNARVILSRTP